MDDTEDDVRYPSNRYTGNYQSSHRHKLPQRNPSSYSQPIGDREEEEEVEGEEEEEEEEEGEEKEGKGEEENGVHREEAEDDEDDEEEEDEEDEVDVIEDDDDDDDDTDDEEEEGDSDGDNRDDTIKDLYRTRSGIGEESGRQRKKRKFKNLGYEFAPRVVTPPVAAATARAVAASASVPRPAFGRTSPADWTENATFVLLDAWGDRFVQLGRKSLRSDEWHEVARKVSQVSKVMRTDAQCRNRLDTLKKKYKKEKMRMAETGEASKWVYFKKMDALLSSLAKPGLSCGLDSGEYVFMNGRDYSNGLDEMRDSPANSESSPHEEDDSDGLPPKKRPRASEGGRGGSSFRLLADSIHKFGEIYEKIENNKRQQVVELEKMRMEFHRDLELQKRKIMERAQAEIAKIRQGDDEEFDVSTENTSG